MPHVASSTEERNFKETMAEIHKLRNTVFLDIETVPDESNYERFFDLYLKKFNREINETMTKTGMVVEECVKEHYESNGGLYAEFGKVVCISLGIVTKEGQLRIKAIADDDEVRLLNSFSKLLEAIGATSQICAHNGTDFDFPFLTRRYWINNLPLPAQFNLYGKKPWEMPFEDTMVMWSGTQWKYRCSLDLLANLFGLPSPKEKMDGKKVSGIFYNQEIPIGERLTMISDYCNEDVFTLVNCYCRMRNIEMFSVANVEFVK